MNRAPAVSSPVVEETEVPVLAVGVRAVSLSVMGVIKVSLSAIWTVSDGEWGVAASGAVMVGKTGVGTGSGASSVSAAEAGVGSDAAASGAEPFSFCGWV